jgi:general secretion pathway protein D
MGIWGVIIFAAALSLVSSGVAASEETGRNGLAQNGQGLVMLAQQQEPAQEGNRVASPPTTPPAVPAPQTVPPKTSAPTAPGQETASPPPPSAPPVPGQRGQAGPAAGFPSRPDPRRQAPGAQPPQPAAAQPMAAQPGQPVSRRPFASGAAPQAQGGMISLNFDDADVFSVIQTVFGDILRVNYVVDPRIKGRVTFRSVAPIAKNQVLQVMEVILRLNAIGVVEDAGLYRIVPLAEVAREPSPVAFGKDPEKVTVQGKSIIQVVPVAYLQSTEVVKLIGPFLSTNAVVLDVPKSNQIIIVDTDASVRRILQLIETFDNEKQKKKRATVYVYQVQNGKAKDITNLLNQIYLGARPGMTGMTGATGLTGGTMGFSGAAGSPSLSGGASRQPGLTGQATAPSAMPTSSVAQSSLMGYQTTRMPGQEMLVSEITRIFSDDVINSVIILATPEDYEVIKETIAKIDIVPRQVIIEGVIAQVSMTDELTLGLAYSLNVKMSVGNGSLSGFAGLNPGTLQTLSSTTQSGSGFTFVGADAGGVVRTYLNALASESKAKLLAAPHILVSDNREARIQVGQQVPLITSETYGSTTVAPQRTVQYKDIGIILKVKPQINASGLVTLEMSQEVSTYETITLYANETQIILDKTEASSSLVVQDGQTVIIGGLIREDNTKDSSGIPFLKNIPILGYLFGNRHRKTSRVEIIILLTPHVIKNQREATAITSEYVDNITGLETMKGGLTKKELLKGGVQIKKGLETGSATPPGDTRPDLIIPLPFGPPTPDNNTNVPLRPGMLPGFAPAPLNP